MADRREFLLGASAGAAALAASAASEGVAMPRYRGVRYQAWTPDSHPHVMLIQRFESREAQEFSVVGVALHGGPWQFVSDAEAKAHVRAIWDASLVESECVHLHHGENAERSIALHKTLGIAHDPNHIRAEHRSRATLQVAKYQSDVKDLMRERELQIGKSHPDLAGRMYAMVRGESFIA